jgi:hypothetical protein
MATIRIGTFNAENLFTRYTFKKTIDSQNDSVIRGHNTNYQEASLVGDLASPN